MIDVNVLADFEMWAKENYLDLEKLDNNGAIVYYSSVTVVALKAWKASYQKYKIDLDK